MVLSLVQAPWGTRSLLVATHRISEGPIQF